MIRWRPVSGWNGLYEVTRAGEIRKVSDRTPVGQWASDQGYMLVRLSRPRAMVLVHRIVAIAFIPNPLGLPEVNHIDNDRANNSVDNLEWCDHAQNIRHAEQQGRMQRDYWTGRRSPNAKLSDDQVRCLRRMRAAGRHSFSSLAECFGISKRAAMRCANGETYPDVQ